MKFLRQIPNLPQLGREVIWRLQPEWQSTEAPWLTVDPGLRQRCTIRWPETLQWKNAELWVQHLRDALELLIPLSVEPVAQDYQGIVVFEVVCDGLTYPIIIDYFDKPDVIETAALKKSALYFKMQYRTTGYDEFTGPDTAPIIPGGYATWHRHTYSFLKAARVRADQPDRRYDVYGRFGFEFAEGIRREAIRKLREQNSFTYYGGDRYVRFSEHLMDAAASKVCIDLPGNGPFCFRLIDYLATGCCIVGIRHPVRMPVPLEPGVHIAYVRDDLSDLIDTCRYYVENDAARMAMQRESRRYFDRYLEKHQLARYYLSRCMEVIERRRAQ